MLSTPKSKVVLIFCVVLIAAYISLPKEVNLLGKRFVRKDIDISIGNFRIKKNFDLALGLDLAGGSHLVFEADTQKIPQDRKKEVLEGLKNVIERRINLFGISEPNIQISSFEGKDRVIVELPGVKDTREAVDLIGQTAQLRFAEFVEVQEEGATPSATLNFTDLTGADLKGSKVVFDRQAGKPVVMLEFTSEGGEKFARITERNIGKPLPIFLDQNEISSPVVQEKIVGGSAVITGNFSLKEAKNLSIQLNAGALPISVKLVEQRSIGAVLGSESIQKSVSAGLVGLAMVLIFMVLSYGRLGLVADMALIIFGVLTLAIYKLIPVVLTLPGIAGFLLSVGMAVDANILIFERFKEERLKRDLFSALEFSFGRAWDSIRDANIATLVTAFVLANPFDFSFLHTSGPVRGFAITLSLGIFVSLFTGIVVSRNFLRVFIREKKDR